MDQKDLFHAHHHEQYDLSTTPMHIIFSSGYAETIPDLTC